MEVDELIRYAEEIYKKEFGETIGFKIYSEEKEKNTFQKEATSTKLS